MLAFLREKFAAYPWLKTAGDLPVVGMGGAIRSLARIDRRRKGYLPDRTHDYVMTREDVKEILEHLAGMDAGERRSVPGLSAERTDIIVAGLVWSAMMQEGSLTPSSPREQDCDLVCSLSTFSPRPVTP